MTFSTISRPLSAPIQLAQTETLIHANTSLADYTSYRVGGAAEWYTAPRTRDDLYAIFDWFEKQDLPLTLLGAGSNLLFLITLLFNF